jgi:cytidylate kinase
LSEHASRKESEVHRFLEGEASLFDRWKIDPNRLSRFTAHEILELAAKGKVLTRGWGGSYLLRSVPHVIAVRVCAPMPFRTQVLMERLGITDPALARREIERDDAAHHNRVQRMFGVDWRDPTLHTLVLNTARVPSREPAARGNGRALERIIG